jgi:hypothetical protein
MSVVVPFTTITDFFDRLTTRYLHDVRPILMYKVENEYRSFSYSELRRNVELFALGLASLAFDAVIV